MFDFLLGYAVGEGTSSPDVYRVKTAGIQSSAADVYVNVSALHRITNPLEIQTGCTGWMQFLIPDNHAEPRPAKHRSGMLGEMFCLLELENPQAYTVLRITRQLNEKSSANFWFEFIETEKLTPEEQ
jgi:hypothetical protein